MSPRPPTRGLRPSPVAPAANGPLAVYQRALQRVQRLQAQRDAQEQQGLAHQRLWAAEVLPLQRQHLQVQRDLALRLADWREADDPRLNSAQRHTLREALCARLRALCAQGQADLAPLHDRHSPLTLAQWRQAQAAAVHAQVADWLGDGWADHAPADDPDAVWDAARQRWQRERAEREARRQARRQARQARRAALDPGATAPRAGTPEHTDTPDTVLRRLYRQLASALHPDRAPDDAERQRRHHLMGEVNAAYAQRDLLTLLRLQGDAAPAERLAALTRLLQEQTARLERLRQHEQQDWRHRLGLPDGTPWDDGALARHRQALGSAWAERLAQAQRDLAQLQDVAGLQRWLNAQRRA